MTESNSSNKKRSNKFPLTLHKTGQYCKKISGKLYYFGTDRKRAMERHLEQAAFLHAGRSPRAAGSADRLSIKMLCNLYLDYQESRATIGELRQRHLSDQVSLLKAFVQFIGPNRVVSDISTMDVQDYRKSLIGAGKAANTINNRLAAVKAMYHWALDNEMIEHSPSLRESMNDRSLPAAPALDVEAHWFLLPRIGDGGRLGARVGAMEETAVNWRMSLV